jgi:hypothetical protein
MNGDPTPAKVILRDEQDDDDDVIEILDSPVKSLDQGARKRNPKEDNLAPVFNMFTKPEQGSSKGKHPASPFLPSVKQETRTRVEEIGTTLASSRQEKRRLDDQIDSRMSKKLKLDPVKQAQP